MPNLTMAKAESEQKNDWRTKKNSTLTILNTFDFSEKSIQHNTVSDRGSWKIGDARALWYSDRR